MRDGPPALRLALDLGGVLVPSFVPRVIGLVARTAGADEEGLRRLFARELRDPLWAGVLPEGAFWRRLLTAASLDDDGAAWSARMPEVLAPLPAAGRIPGWSRRVPIVVLSNHLRHWVEPQLAAAGVTACVDRMIISCETGIVKPDPRAFLPLADLGVPPGRVLYVDDHPDNLAAARDAGLTTLMADEAGEWADRADALIGPLSREAREGRAV